MKAMKVLALNYITFVVVVMSMAGLYSCSTDYMAYDVELKDGIYFASDSLNYQFGMQKGEDFGFNLLNILFEFKFLYFNEIIPI